MNKVVCASGLFLTAAMACAKQPPTSAPTPAAASASAEIVSRLITSVASSRATLDSAVSQLYRTSGDTSTSALARSRQLRKRVSVLDSTYRANLADLRWTVNASSAGVMNGNGRFPVEAPPAPFVHAFADGENWMLESPLVHEIGKNSAYIVIVPRGFVTDFASIPKPLQILRGSLPIAGRYGNAAVVHDYLYWKQDCTREQADNIMEIAMMEAGVSLLERKLIHEGVRQFGQTAWDGNRRDRQAGLMRTVAPPNDEVPQTGAWPDYREWLRATRAKEGLEYRVPASVCAMGDSVRIPD